MITIGKDAILSAVDHMRANAGLRGGEKLLVVGPGRNDLVSLTVPVRMTVEPVFYEMSFDIKPKQQPPAHRKVKGSKY